MFEVDLLRQLGHRRIAGTTQQCSLFRRFLIRYSLEIVVGAIVGNPLSARELSIIVQKGDVVAGRTLTGFDGESPGPRINDLGDILWSAELDNTFERSLFTTSGRILAEPGSVFEGIVTHGVDDEDLSIAINNAGQVLFSDVSGLGGAFLLDRNIVVTVGTTIAGETLRSGAQSIGDNDFDLALNDHGEYVLEARLSRNGEAEHSALFTPTEIVARTGDVVTNGAIPLVLGSFTGAAINSFGAVAYSGRLNEDGSPHGGFNAILIDGEAIVQPGDRIAGRQISHVGELYALEDSNNAVFSATLDSGEQAFFQGDELLATLHTGLMIDGNTIGGFRQVWANTSGHVVLMTTINGTDRRAVFTPTELIAQEGDVVDGKMISWIRSDHPSVNARGDIVFLAKFDDGAFGIVLSSVPEPSSVVVVVPVLFAFMATCRRMRSAQSLGSHPALADTFTNAKTRFRAAAIWPPHRLEL